MTPVSLNPLGPAIQDQNQLFISPNKHDSTSLSCRTFFDILDQRQTGDIRELRHDNQEDDKLVFHGGSSSNHQVCNSSFVSPHQPVMADPSCACGHNLSFYKVEEEENKSGYGSAKKWMSSKIRLTRKMMSPSNSLATDKAFNITTPTFQSQGHGNTQRNPSSYNSNSITRVCADCNTSSTPLWRSGPKGPKSLCNACGIRQRKARKAMAEAANGFASSMDASSTKTRVHHKEKKCRTKHFGRFKNRCKSTATCITTAGTSQGERKLDFKDFAISFRSNSAFQQVFSRDEEVAEAALLLMDLSCGFVYF